MTTASAAAAPVGSTARGAVATFHSLLPQLRPPMRADRSALGTLPTRAYRYCEAVTSASGFGWYLFPPAELSLLWDGTSVFWSSPALGTGADWLPLEDAAQFPGFRAAFDAAAPEALRGAAPPFLTALPEPGLVQVWTGLIARTAPEWSLLLRPVANLPQGAGYALFEGIVETDRWFGPLFVNLRLTRTHTPVRLRADYPIAQAQPLPRSIYAEDTLGAFSHVAGLSGLGDADWEAYRATIVEPNARPNRPYGEYAVRTRKRKGTGCPFAAAAASAA